MEAMNMPHKFLTTRKTGKVVPVWDYRGLLLSLGSSDQIVKRIEKAGYDAPAPVTVNGWRFRGRVPSQWVPLFLKWAIQAGTIKSLDQLLVKGKGGARI
jgi:hypothetical protein